ncbi:hypothetical protein HK096_001255, partial [Nowakowskiella sp. JEL0078]
MTQSFKFLTRIAVLYLFLIQLSTTLGQLTGGASTAKELALLSPKFYAAVLLKEADCPGTDSGDCKYLTTPSGSSDQLGFNWTCPVGFYCASPVTDQTPAIACTP